MAAAQYGPARSAMTRAACSEWQAVFPSLDYSEATPSGSFATRSPSGASSFETSATSTALISSDGGGGDARSASALRQGPATSADAEPPQRLQRALQAGAMSPVQRSPAQDEYRTAPSAAPGVPATLVTRLNGEPQRAGAAPAPAVHERPPGEGGGCRRSRRPSFKDEQADREAQRLATLQLQAQVAELSAQMGQVLAALAELKAEKPGGRSRGGSLGGSPGSTPGKLRRPNLTTRLTTRRGSI